MSAMCRLCCKYAELHAVLQKHCKYSHIPYFYCSEVVCFTWDDEGSSEVTEVCAHKLESIWIYSMPDKLQ